mgnify:CR=1 FL=1
MKKYLKYIIFIAIIIIIIIGLNWKDKSEITAIIKIKDYGNIKVKLDKSNAPITVDNFVKLSKNKFYDNLTFHRIIDGFMIQGGDPLKNGTGNGDQKIKGEFKNNGVNNLLKHKRGTISMARSSDYNSGSCQFFIMQKDNESLDGNYAAFGNVISGIEIVDKIVENVSKYGDENGLIPEEYQPIIETIEIIEKSN